MAGNTATVDILHPLSTRKWEHCRKWNDCCPTHCAVLHGRVAILTWKYRSNDVVHISSTDLHSWTTITIPYSCMSLTTYKSQFVAVGGRDCSTLEPTDLVLTSDTGLEWQSSLPHIRTKRYLSSSVGTTSLEVLVVAGGYDSGGKILNDVEVLIEDNWHSAFPLPKPCYGMTSTLHRDEVVFTDRRTSSIYSCNISTLIASCTTICTHNSPWRHWKVPYGHTTTISYFSRLVNINENGNIKGYCSVTQSWVEATSVGDKMTLSYNVSAATLPTGDIVVASHEGVDRVKVSESPFYPDSRFESDVLSKLQAVMGIQMVSVLANKTSQLTTSTGMELHTRYDKRDRKISLPDPQRNPIQYISEFMLQWSMSHSVRPPTWRQLLGVLQDIGLIELSQQIEAFMKSKRIST